MYLTISKRFELSSSHRLYLDNLTDAENFAVYGYESTGKYGHGHNYVANFVFNGPVDEKTGMMINITEIKKKIMPFLESRYDHRYFNNDTSPFDKIPPTSENIAVAMLDEAEQCFSNSSAIPVACHLSESPEKESTVYADGTVESHFWLGFSSARVTRTPHLSSEENTRLFGNAASPSGHGHHYRLRITLKDKIDERYGLIVHDKEIRSALNDLTEMFDHKNLNLDIEDFKNIPTTTEMLARYIFDLLKDRLPVDRLKLYENDNFFVEYNSDKETRMSVLNHFYASHRLHSEYLSDEENVALYDKCNNKMGHGHRYEVECSILSDLDEKTGIIYNLTEMNNIVKNILQPWNYRHLNLEVDEFKNIITTSENIISVLWDKMQVELEDKLDRIRIWETPNNRFTLRKDNTRSQP